MKQIKIKGKNSIILNSILENIIFLEDNGKLLNIKNLFPSIEIDTEVGLLKPKHIALKHIYIKMKYSAGKSCVGFIVICFALIPILTANTITKIGPIKQFIK